VDGTLPVRTGILPLIFPPYIPPFGVASLRPSAGRGRISRRRGKRGVGREERQLGVYLPGLVAGGPFESPIAPRKVIKTRVGKYRKLTAVSGMGTVRG